MMRIAIYTKTEKDGPLAQNITNTLLSQIAFSSLY
jgi:hypothetical protein